MTLDEKKSWAEELLKRKAEELGRLPKKDDFDEPTRSRIKAYLGPWPRALEAAGIKPLRDDDRIMRNKEKRIRAKRRRTMARKNAKEQSKERNGY